MRASGGALQRIEAAILEAWIDPPAQQELNRIERELDANDPPGRKPPLKRGGGQN